MLRRSWSFMLEGTIIKNISNSYTVLCNQKRIECIPRGVLRHEKVTPLVGDYCIVDEQNHQIIEILPRKNEQQRPHVANVDYALIVTSLRRPTFSSYLLDKEIASVILSHVKPIICFTKLDLLEEKSKYETIKKYYESIDIPCFDNQHLEPLLKYLKGSLVVLTGQTGAGKSSLLNKINPSLCLATNEISEALQRGVHTTRHSEIYEEKGVRFLDTPGFSALELKIQDKKDLSKAFQEFANYSCKFKDCLHDKEIECGVKEAVKNGNILKSRYENYLKILEEINHESSRFIPKK